MSMNKISDYVLYRIMDFIPDNVSSVNFVATCNYYKALFYKYGYIKYYRVVDNKSNIPIETIKHRNTLNTYDVSHIYNPWIWFPFWPKTVILSFCTSRCKIDPRREVNTEVLHIIDDRSDYIHINWKKFPKLITFKTTKMNFNVKDMNLYKKSVNVIIC